VLYQAVQENIETYLSQACWEDQSLKGLEDSTLSLFTGKDAWWSGLRMVLIRGGGGPGDLPGGQVVGER
jgi:hypothetical protein